MQSQQPLHDAVMADDMPQICRILTWKLIDPNKDYPRRLTETGEMIRFMPPPLFLCRSAEAARLLLVAGANVEYEYQSDDNTMYGMPLHFAAEYGRDGVVAQLISVGANVNCRNCFGQTPLHLATSLACVRILISAKADIHALDDGGYTPLLAACLRPVEIVDALLREGADIDHVPQNGVTALYTACDYSQYATAMLLLSSGADSNLSCCKHSYHRNGRGALHAAVDPLRTATGVCTFTARALARDEGTQFELVVGAAHRQQQLKLVEALVANGAEVNRLDDEGCTPIMLTEDPGLIRQLYLVKADPDLGNAEHKSERWWSIVNEVCTKKRGLEYVHEREMGIDSTTEAWPRSMRLKGEL